MLSQHLLCLYRLLVPSSPLAKYRPADGLRNTVEAAQPAELDEVYEVLHRANMGKQFGTHGQTISNNKAGVVPFRKIPQTWHGMSTSSCLVASKIPNVELFNLRTARTPDKCTPLFFCFAHQAAFAARELGHLVASCAFADLCCMDSMDPPWQAEWSCSTGVALHADSEKHWLRKEASAYSLYLIMMC